MTSNLSEQTSATQSSIAPTDGSPLRVHRLTVLLAHVVAVDVSLSVLTGSEVLQSHLALLSTGAILATFGSALTSIAGLWERDRLARVKANVDVLRTEILEDADNWRRWPFLPRVSTRKLLNNNTVAAQLTSPKITVDVGTHEESIDLPTVLEDFFDLPVIANFLTLARFRNQAHTFASREQAEGATDGGKARHHYADHAMKYECLLDTWRSILVFRISRYVTHFGAALVVWSVALVALLWRAVIT